MNAHPGAETLREYKASTSGHPSFMELDVRTWASGLYMARMRTNEGNVIGEVKCAVIR